MLSKRFSPIKALAIVFMTTLMATFSPSLFATKPNVVLIITDDQGYGDLSCHGNPVLKTPHLDKLHSECVRLHDFHVAPTCAPTRAALQSGHWTNRTGVWHTIMGRSMIRADEPVMGQVFQDSGYATGMFGKWHLGDNYPYRPEDRGYQEVLRHGAGGVGQTPDVWDNAYFDDTYFHNGKLTKTKGYCSDVYFDYATKFIDKSASEGKPFFAYISTNAPHSPMHCPEEFMAPYKNVKWPAANEATSKGKTGKGKKAKGGKGVNPAFYGMIANIDYNVGKLRKHLEAKGLEENTIFCFMTDNGSAGGWRAFNAGMKSGKGSEYDGGHRVPFFCYWPAGKLTGGRDVVEVTHACDILPTMIDYCGLKKPEGIKFDGTSIRPLMDGKASQAGGSWPDRIMVTDSQRVLNPIKWRKSSVMTSQWRLVNGKELYEIKKDPGQTNNVINDHPEVANRLKQFYEDWWTELEPTFKVDALIYVGHDGENPATLTSHDWLASSTTPWNQSHIRGGKKGPKGFGPWGVKVVQDGTYEISLRRWPRESGYTINQAVEPGPAVPGTGKAFRQTPGKAISAVKAVLEVGGVKKEAKVAANAQEVTFTVDLKAGDTRLDARFYAEDGSFWGAYYTYVLRK